MGTKASISTEDLQYFLEYAAQFLGNCGNYKGIGDSKLIPRCQETAFAALASVSEKTNEYYAATKGAIFSTDPASMLNLGYPDDGHMTTVRESNL